MTTATATTRAPARPATRRPALDWRLRFGALSLLWGLALSLVALSEDRPTRVRVAGLGIGFLGVLTVLGAWQGFHGLDATGTAMALLASLSYPVGWIYVRRTLAGTGNSHLSMTGGQLL